MKIRKITFIAAGRFDCEIEHPSYGWIPFTATEDDAEAHGRAIFAACAGAKKSKKTDVESYIEGIDPPPPVDPLDALAEIIDAQVQAQIQAEDEELLKLNADIQKAVAEEVARRRSPVVEGG